MTIDIAAEDHELLQKLVTSGRFSSVSEAVHESLLPFANEPIPDEEWKRRLDVSIDEGSADVDAGRYRPAGELLRELKTRYGA